MNFDNHLAFGILWCVFRIAAGSGRSSVPGAVEWLSALPVLFFQRVLCFGSPLGICVIQRARLSVQSSGFCRIRILGLADIARQG